MNELNIDYKSLWLSMKKTLIFLVEKLTFDSLSVT